MRLERLELNGFQSFRERQSISFDEQITFLAGRNNVGKSALLRALLLPVAKQDGVRPEFEVTYTWSAMAEEIAQAFTNPNFDQVRPKIAEAPITRLSADFEYLTPGERLGCGSINIEGLGRLEGQPDVNPGWQGGPFPGTATGASEVRGLATEQTKRVAYFGPRRIDQGRQMLTPQAELAPDGRNLTHVLYYLKQNHPLDQFRQLEEFIAAAFPEIETITTMLDPAETSGSYGEPHVLYRDFREPVPLRLCGTGVEQMLALAAGLLTASDDQLVLIDEPQAYLHPHAERSLLRLLEEHPEHQYVIATHSGLLLNSKPLSQARLVTMKAGVSQIAELESEGGLLAELGFSAADLWLADRVLWVEGASEKAVYEVLADASLSDADRSGLAIREMPDKASRFAAGSKRAEAIYQFCNRVTEAVSPLPVAMRFIFDSDEKSDEDMSRIRRVSAERARFLPMRELENYFLAPELLHEAIRERCEVIDTAAPSPSEVAAKLDEILSDTGNRALFPSQPTGPDNPAEVIRGSQALQMLYWTFLTSEYRKVEDGRRLARIAVDGSSDAIRPLNEVLGELVRMDG